MGTISFGYIKGNVLALDVSTPGPLRQNDNSHTGHWDQAPGPDWMAPGRFQN